ncbi:RcnB family protein [Roseibium aggregatum]|uniref:RcnB family protein n=1 Tax=Roseibium aggregatum TaxID=187304 RepID=A0A939EA97_9HYPH|nr:RcnB family protein [Roseibium aggregatum]MBN9669228.1 RcnB family protein [Roseibium aggregatum]
MMGTEGVSGLLSKGPRKFQTMCSSLVQQPRHTRGGNSKWSRNMQKNNLLRTVVASSLIFAAALSPALAQGAGQPPKQAELQHMSQPQKVQQKTQPQKPQKKKQHKVSKKAKKPAWMKKGGKMPKNEMGSKVGYQKHNLKKPPQGYQWVRKDDNYLLVQIATGVIASIIAGTR